ncbi:hypothetical protein CMQ_652 [Grosmannia clavigera kw1407]|uniref:Meiotically up-regulated gene 154 protein n=1 Tax=Grosmannia clavigera (strain kw1407 / UAMH 11150) TaxID=655863 RepID=F0XFJ0_GROCL|nr:uncharacterized protein CMQ_652 [Grosmannia clavigera kw1407]EFX03724.1 hypothetical protein CMQ_652 [Grosmannia clavigera kw1407]
MPRLVRRQPLMQRIAAAINPWDFLLWLSEEIETRELDSQTVGTQAGLVANFLFLLARANLGPSNSADDDVFGDASSHGWFSYLVQMLVWTGFTLSVANAVFVFSRKRHYRLFEASIDKAPGTPSAHRVRVQSSPSSSSPFRLLSDLLSFESAESRSHPDSSRDVWELAIWDPRPASLAFLSFFSPLHVLVYLFELPLDPLESRPSVTVFKCLVLQVGLSAIMTLMQSRNDQRQKDAAIIQKEVFHEYDEKFVRPQLHPIVRDVGTQVTMNDILSAGAGSKTEQIPVEIGTPTTLIRRSFQTHPNQNYVRHVDPDYGISAGRQSSIAAAPRLFTPVNKAIRHSDAFTPSYGSISQPRQSMPSVVTPSYSATTSMAPTPASAVSTIKNSSAAANSSRLPTASTGTSTNFGGSLGVYSHVNSPLKKATSLNDVTTPTSCFSPRNSRELAAIEQRDAAERAQRRSSPLKEDRARPANDEKTPFRSIGQSTASVNPFARARPTSYKYERFPSRC